MVKCETCGNEFEPRRGKKANRFCSPTCYNEWRKGKPSVNPDGLEAGRGWNKGQSAEWAQADRNVNWKGGKVTLTCQECGKEYQTWPYLKDKSKYCSKECAQKHTLAKGQGWNKKPPVEKKEKKTSSPKNKAKAPRIIRAVTLKCKHCQAEYQVSPYRVGESNYCSRQCAGKDRFGGTKHPLYGKKREDLCGENNPNWNGGSSRDYRSHYNSYEYITWRRQVFKRDNFTCQQCGQRGGRIEAHHKIGWAEDETRRYEVDNGMTVCTKCHIDLDHYRARFFKKESE